MGRYILSLVALDDTGDSKYRLEWPMKALAREFPDWRVENLRVDAKERFTLTKEADLLFLVQSSDLDLIPILELRRKSGLPTVVEYNDNFYESPSWSPVAKAWSSPLLWRNYEYLMEAGDHVVTTSDGLRQLFSKSTSKPITVLPNILPAPPPSHPTKSKKPSIGWAGSLGHMADLISIQRELKSLSKDFEIHLMGNESIPSVLNISGLHFTKWSSVERYFVFWDPVWFGVIPLKDTPYNNCRSDIKIIEMLSRGVVPIVKYSRTYASLIDKLALPSYKDNSELEPLIRKIEPEQRADIITRGIEYIKKSRVRDSARVNLFNQLLKHLPEKHISNPGYFETEGTAYPVSRLQELVKHSPDSIESFATENPKNPDAQIVYLKERLGSPTFKDNLKDCLDRFPKDLRFKLFYFEKFGDPKLVVEYLKDCSFVERKFWQKMVIQSLGRTPELQETLIGFYPDDPSLLFNLAERLRHDGNFEAAHEFYLRLSSLKHEIDQGYLDAMIKGTE